jgi:hypothetical protein
MDAGGLVKTARGMAAMVDPVIMATVRQVVVGDVLPVVPDLLHPLRAARITAGFLAATASIWIFCVISFEELFLITLNAIQHSASEHQVDVRVAFFCMESKEIWMLIAADRLSELTRSGDLLLFGQLTRQGEFHFVVERAICTLMHVQLYPKFAWIISGPRRHISTFSKRQLAIVTLGETTKSRDVVVLIDGQPIFRSATALHG